MMVGVLVQPVLPASYRTSNPTISPGLQLVMVRLTIEVAGIDIQVVEG
jgi:hypothetical protein